MTTAAEVYAKLNEPFPREMERSLNKGGTRLTYIPQAEVIARLNTVLGLDGWSLEVKRVWRDPSDEEFVLAHVTLTANIAGVTVHRDGFGGQKINMTKQSKPVDLGDDYKGAVSDAMKKATTTLGVGLYLARDAEALEIEASQNQADEPEIVVPEIWTTFMEQAGMLTTDGKRSLNEFWASYSGGRPKPTLASHTEEDLEALCGEAARLILNGDYVNDPA